MERTASPAAEVRVLIVEDDGNTRECLCRLLESFGYTCESAADGVEALARVHTFMPQAVIMDLNLPLLDGIEATRLIRSNPISRTIPVVALTANANREDQRRAESAGVDVFLTKPTNLGELLSRLLQLAPLPRARE